MDFNDVYNELEGYDAEQNPKAIISLSLKIYKKDINIFVPQNEIVTEDAIIRLNPVENAIQVSVQFPSPLDSNLALMWNLCKSYASMVSSLSEHSNNIPLLTLNIIPHLYKGEGFASAAAPLYFNLQASEPGMQVDSLTFTFNIDDFGIYQTDEINEALIDGEVEREIAEQERLEQIEEEKRLERELYLEKRNEMLRQQRYR